MPDILTVTLNPALDMSSAVDKVVPEDKLRCAQPVYDPGGGGINVARAAVHLGGQAQAFVAVGGYRGEMLVKLVEADGVMALPYWVEGETRLSLAVIDRSTGRQYRFVMPGPAWSETMVAEAIDRIGAALTQGAFLVLSGSQPPGVPVDFPTELATVAAAKGARVFLDTSGPPLKALLAKGAARQHVLRLDGTESDSLAGRHLNGIGEVADFAQSLINQGVAEIVVLALGGRGSVLAEDGRRWHAATPPVKVISKVGAGDSFVGAFVLAQSRGAAPQEALRAGVAAASAAVMSDATALCRAEDYDGLYNRVDLTEI